MMTARSIVLMAAMLTSLTVAGPLAAGDCTGHVVGVRPISQYNPATGAGFLAVRSGPGSQYAQIGELYNGDEIAVWARSGSWYQVRCMAGRCMNPRRGPAMPTGWVFGRYLSIGGVCP